MYFHWGRVYIYPVIEAVTNQNNMSEYQSEIIEQMGNVSSDMAHIIGRYKGSMEAFSETLLSLSRIGSMDDFTKKHLTDLAVRMQNMVAENEQLWQNRGKREVPTDIVELERA